MSAKLKELLDSKLGESLSAKLRGVDTIVIDSNGMCRSATEWYLSIAPDGTRTLIVYDEATATKAALLFGVARG